MHGRAGRSCIGGELRKARGARIGALGRIPLDPMGNAVIANLETAMVLAEGAASF